MKTRIQYIDAIRGFAIILVVMAHTIAWNYPDWKEVCLFDQSQPYNYMVGGVVWQIIYSFHMALFFMVTGYLSGNTIITKVNVLNRLKNKTIRLLVPYITTGFLILFVRGNWGYWFLLSLFEMSVLWIVLSPLMDRINANNTFWKDVLIMAVVYILLRAITYFFPLSIGDINFGTFIKYVIPFFFGILMKRHKWLEDIIRKPVWFTVCLLAFLLLFCVRYLTDYPVLYSIITKIDFFFSVLALLSCAIVFHIFMNGFDNKMELFFAYIGKVSLPIYILHNLFVIQIPTVGLFILKQNAVTSITIQIVYSVIVSAISITLCVLLYRFLRKSPLMKLLLFGEK